MSVSFMLNSYMKELQAGNLDGLLQLFTKDAVVITPLYGTRPAQEFYAYLVQDTTSIVLEPRGIYIDEKWPDRGIVHFFMTWVIKSGGKGSFECIDIIQLVEGKIAQLEIIFDTFYAPPGAAEQAKVYGKPSRLCV